MSQGSFEYNSDTGQMENTGTSHEHKATLEYESATIYRRIAALFIDNLIVWIVIIPLSNMVHPLLYPDDQGGYMLPVVGSIGVAAGLALYLWLFTGLTGKTPGKRLLKIKVVNNRGKTPGLIRALWRETIGRLILLFSFTVSSILYLFSNLSAFWYDTTVFNSYPERGFRKPSDREYLNVLEFYDRICGTRVVKAK
jgi:uncharacterized RDD family membrane protein YckC